VISERERCGPVSTATDLRRAELGSRLARLRTTAGLGAGEVADAAGLDPAYYREVEAGRGDLAGFTYLHLLRVADALHVPPARVLGD
jgi:transcriptional regulator with XRE-family HTH domain